MLRTCMATILAASMGLLTGCATMASAPLAFDQLAVLTTYPVSDTSVRLTVKQRVNRDINLDDVALLHAALWMQSKGFVFFDINDVNSRNGQTVVTSFRPSVWLEYRADLRHRGSYGYSTSIASPYWWHGPMFDPYWLGGTVEQTVVSNSPSVSMTVTGFAQQNAAGTLYASKEVIASLSPIYRATLPATTAVK